MITRSIETCLRQAKAKGWDKTYWAIDIHGTILRPTYTNNQISTEFYQRVGYHPYEGVAFDLDERVRIQRSLGENIALILQSHGLLSVGRTVADAFYIMYYLNRACEIQMAAAQLAALSPIHTIAPHLSQHACEQLMGVEHERQQVWQAWLRRLDRLDTSYKD